MNVMVPYSRSRRSSFPALALFVALVAALVLLPTISRADPDPLAQALPRAEESGSYRFVATLREKLLPKPLPANVGQSGGWPLTLCPGRPSYGLGT